MGKSHLLLAQVCSGSNLAALFAFPPVFSTEIMDFKGRQIVKHYFFLGMPDKED